MKKRIPAVLLLIALIFTMLPVTALAADDGAAAQTDAAAFGSASAYTTAAWRNDAMSESECRALLNGEELHPQPTGWFELDSLIASMLAPYEEEDTYTKLSAMYDWLVKNVTYSWNGYSKQTAPAYEYFTEIDCLKSMTYFTCMKKSIPDDMANRTMHILSDREGVCYDYAIAFAVICRYVGIEAYVRTGYFSFEAVSGSGHHGWSVLVLNGTEYIFDPQRDARNWEYNGLNRYYFGITQEKATRYYPNYAAADRTENPKRDASMLSMTADREEASGHVWGNPVLSSEGVLTRACTLCGKTEPVSGWQKEDGTWYYYGEGIRMTDWQKVDGKWYYLDPETGAMLTGWQKVSGKWYYLNTSMKTGWQKIDGKWYYLSNAMRTGWQKISGKWYYLDPETGAMQTGWQKVNGKWYYLNTSMQTGWQKLDGKWYYLDPKSGAMLTGLQKIDGKWYYLNTSMQTGWQKLSGSWYYFNTAMKTGWQKLSGKWYYLDPETGIMQTGWLTVDGKTYYLNSSMLTGLQEIDGKTYYLNTSVQTGWQTIGEDRYYFDESGAMLTGLQEIEGKTYYLNTSVQTGWQTIGEDRYYFDESGAMLTGQQTIDGVSYDFGENGLLLPDRQNVDESDDYLNET